MYIDERVLSVRMRIRQVLLSDPFFSPALPQTVEKLKVTEQIMKSTVLLFLAGFSLMAMTRADVLQLKGGKTLNGKYLGGSVGTIRFETQEGAQEFETAQVLVITFTPTETAGLATQPVAQASPVSAASGVKVPAGTVLLIRTLDPVSSTDSPGKKFSGTLETDLRVGDKVAAPAGTKVYGVVESSQQARRIAGKSELSLRLTDLGLGGRLVPIVTSDFSEVSSQGSFRKTARGAAGGAAIGAVFGEAGAGAAVGTVASTVKKGENVAIPPSTLLEFRLVQPLELTH